MDAHELSRRRAAAQCYVESYVALQRLLRRANDWHADFDRWMARVALARQRGEPRLAVLARRRALLAAENEIRALRLYWETAPSIERLREQALA